MVTVSVSQPNSRAKITDNEYELLRLQKDIGGELIQNMQDILRDNGINFTEDLSNSFSLEMFHNTASVTSNSPYAGFVDRGMMAGTFVNFDALHDWVQVKIGLEEPELTNVTWAIIHKIHGSGIKPKRYAKKAIKRLIGEHGVASMKRTSKPKTKKAVKQLKTTSITEDITKLLKKARKVLNNINSMTRRLRPAAVIKRHLKKQQGINKRVMKKVIKSERKRGNI